MISDHLKIKLADFPGINEATSHLEGGRQVIEIYGERATCGPFASDNEVEAAIRLALGIPEVTPMTEETTDSSAAATVKASEQDTAPTATPLPPAIGLATASIPVLVRKPVQPGSFVAGLRAMMDEARDGIAQARADGHRQVADAVAELADAKHATARVAGTIASAIKDEAADVMAELGQISNEL